MKLRATPEGLIAEDADRDRWVRLPGEDDLLAFLREGEPARERAAAAIAAGDAVEADPAAAGLPFVPRSMRAFMLWESHVIRSSRMLVKHFFPAPVWRRSSARFERVPAGRSRSSSRTSASTTTPTFYVANHTTVLADGEDMWWPSHTQVPRLRARARLRAARSRSSTRRPRRRARRSAAGSSSTTGAPATCRPTTPATTSSGPVIKSKTFANSIGPDVVTADELPTGQAATRPRPRRRRALVRGHHRATPPTTSARCSPTPPRASASTPAT